MSARLMMAAFRFPAATPSERLVLVALASFADDDGSRIFPSMATIAAMVCLKERRTRRIVRAFEDAGLLMSEGGGAGGARTATRHFSLNVAMLCGAPVVRDHGTGRPPVPERSDGGTGIPSTPVLQAPQLVNRNIKTHQGARGARLPATWSLPEEWKVWALAEQPTWDEKHVQTVAANFADHWHAKAGRDAAKLDWLATWRKWVRTEGPKPAPRGAVGTPPPAVTPQRSCVGCGSAKVLGSVGRFWHCGAEVCRDKAKEAA